MQYSLKSLLILMLIVAMGCILLPRFNPLVDIVWRVVMTLFPAALTVGIVYGKDEQRTFSIGCAASVVATWHYPHDVGSSLNGSMILIALIGLPLQIALFIAGGVLAVWLRRRLESAQPPVRTRPPHPPVASRTPVEDS